MNRLFAILAVAATTTLTTNLFAVDVDYHGNPHSVHGGNVHWVHRPVHPPNLTQLDALSDRLAMIAQHLHQDAHQLSQDHQHSASIEAFVDRLDRLQTHMHELLHNAPAWGPQSMGVVHHAKGDVSQAKDLMRRLYGELQHQGNDGARESDFQAMAHMPNLGQRSVPADPSHG